MGIVQKYPIVWWIKRISNFKKSLTFGKSKISVCSLHLSWCFRLNLQLTFNQSQFWNKKNKYYFAIERPSKYNNIITVLITVPLTNKPAWGQRNCMANTVISPYVCLCFSVFIVLCIVSVTAGAPFHPKVISLYNLMSLNCIMLVQNTCREGESAGRGGRL